MKNSSAIVLILIAVGLFYTFIDPEYQKVKILQNETNQYEDILKNVNELGEKRNSLLAKYKTIPQAELTKMDKALPTSTDTVKLAVILDSIAARYGVAVRSVKAEGGATSESAVIVQPTTNTYETTTINFTILSSYENFRKFMHDLEQSLRIVDVNALSFSTAENGINQYEVSIKTYWIK